MKCLTLMYLAVLPLAFAASARADIYQWEYINPADPSQGKQQSTTLAADGAGVNAVPGAYLAGRALTMAYLIGADLAGADGYFSNLTNADLSQANLTNANFTNTNFAAATLTDADFTGADIHGANFDATACFGSYGCFPIGSGLTLAQLYSTASYQAHDLRGINLRGNDLAGGHFAGQNLDSADFGNTKLTGANFRDANLANAKFVLAYDNCFPSLPPGCGAGLAYATLTDADLTAADARGSGLDLAELTGAITTNLILPDGQINGLDLDVAALLVVRDYDGSTWDRAMIIPITIDQHLAMGPGGTLRMVFEPDAWNSTISFAGGIPVSLGGTLELTFADGVILASQVGRTFDLFDWTGVAPTGAFAVSSPYQWNVSNLYTTGEVTLLAVPEAAGIVLVLAAAGVLAGSRCRRRRNRIEHCQTFEFGQGAQHNVGRDEDRRHKRAIEIDSDCKLQCVQRAESVRPRMTT